MPLQATSGAASYDGFGGGAASKPVYIEDVFSTWNYTGNGSTQTITNGIDLSGKGGMVWIKNRGGYSHALFDTTRGVENLIKSNTTEAQSNLSGSLTNFTTSGFSLGSAGIVNDGSGSYPNNVSWTFRNQPKFKAQLAYTGNGGTLSVAHALGSKPGCIMIKRTDSTGDWLVITRKSDGNIYAMYLNQTAGQFYDGTEGALWSSSDVSINWINSNVASGFNISGATYIMHLFAHNAGGFGLAGTDNVITCGSYTGTGAAGKRIVTGFEPQWIMIKRVDTADSWYIFDTIRGMSYTAARTLLANASNSELNYGGSLLVYPNGIRLSTTSAFANANGGIYAYIAIRQPMSTPVDPTKTFKVSTRSGNSSSATVTSTFAPDIMFSSSRNGYPGSAVYPFISSRIMGGIFSFSNQMWNGMVDSTGVSSWDQLGVSIGNASGGSGINESGGTYVDYLIKRGTNFADMVAYLGDGVDGSAVQHSLGVTPELIFARTNDTAENWAVGYFDTFGLPVGTAANLKWDTNQGRSGNTCFPIAPNSSVFYVSNAGQVGINYNNDRHVAYLFATCPGISKVSKYTGTGSAQTINCGFTSGARFVMIKRTDAAGDWFLWDTARGITSGNDPYLLFNSTQTEITTTDYISPQSVGFGLTSSAPAGLNASGGSYLYLAIA